MLSDLGQYGWAFQGVLCCSALLTSVVELVAAVTAVSSESHRVQAGQAPEVQHGREGPGIADAGLGIQAGGLWGNRKCRARLTFAACLVFPGTRVC